MEVYAPLEDAITIEETNAMVLGNGVYCHPYSLGVHTTWGVIFLMPWPYVYKLVIQNSSSPLHAIQIG